MHDSENETQLNIFNIAEVQFRQKIPEKYGNV